MVAKIKCHVVKKMGNPVTISTDDYWRIRNPTVSRTHLLNRITDPLKKIQILRKLLASVRGLKASLTEHSRAIASLPQTALGNRQTGSRVYPLLPLAGACLGTVLGSCAHRC